MDRAEKQSPPAGMSCGLCGSGNEAEFSAEMIIHFSGIKNLDKPGVWAFPKLLVCLDCGFSRFTVPEAALALLTAGTPTRETCGPCRMASDRLDV